jgi:hypothetical protein
VSIQISPRYHLVERAYLDVDKAVSDAIEKHALTYGEVFSILGRITVEWARYAVKDERKEEAQK